MSEKDDYDVALEHLKAGMAENGVACVAVGDGEVFYFSRKKLMEIVAKMDESGKDEAIVFVKTGPRKRFA